MDFDFESTSVPDDITKEITDLIEDWDEDIMEEFIQIEEKSTQIYTSTNLDVQHIEYP